MKRARAKLYFLPDSERSISLNELKRADKDTQIEAMRSWFFQNYANPVEECPYESAEGGYIYIWGGPYDAREMLEGEFSESASAAAIDALVAELEQEAWEWSGRPKPDDIDHYLADQAGGISSYLHVFQYSILDIEKLIEADIDQSVSACFERMLFASIVGALEAYFFDAFTSTVLSNRKLLRRLVETTPEFQSEKIPVSDVFRARDAIKKRVKDYLSNVVWHRLEKVRLMYRDTLEVKFPKDMKVVMRAIATRHDIVHRNGKSLDGSEVEITTQDLTRLTQAVEKLVSHIDAQVQKLGSDRRRGPDGQDNGKGADF